MAHEITYIFVYIKFCILKRVTKLYLIKKYIFLAVFPVNAVARDVNPKKNK